MKERYARQEVLPEIGKEGQQQLKKSSVAIIGCGALGSVAAELLARSGVGKLLLFDYDFIELSNLQRQALYTEADVGKAKATTAQEHLTSINSEISISSCTKAITAISLQLLVDVDLILDCTDNLQTRFLLNEYAMKNNTPFIYAGAVETRGMLYVVDPASNRACFNCIFEALKSVENCEDFGVLNSTTHLAASMQVAETLKILLNRPYTNELLSFDLWNTRFDLLNVTKSPECAVCKGEFERLHGNILFVEYCSTQHCIKARPNKEILLNLDSIRNEGEILEEYGELGFKLRLQNHEVIIRQNGFLDFLDTKDQDFAKEVTEKVYSFKI